MKNIIRQIFLATFIQCAAISTHAIVPEPAPAQNQAIAIVGVVAHIGNGQRIENAVLTFADGRITHIANNDGNLDLSGHKIYEFQGQHVYPGFILPNTTLGLNEVASTAATLDTTETGTLNPSVRSIIAYNTDSEMIATMRFNGILSAQVTPQGGMVRGSSSVVQLDAWNWEDAAYKTDEGMHINWPRIMTSTRNDDSGVLEWKKSENYDDRIAQLTNLFANARRYTGKPVNLNLKALAPLFTGEISLYFVANGAREIVSAIQFAHSFDINKIVIVGGREALQVKELLVSNSIPVIYQRTHELPYRVWHDVDIAYRTPALLHEAGIKVSLGFSPASLNGHRNLPFLAGTTAAYGLDRETALTLITSNTAEILGIDESLGTLEVGKDATLFISRGDALDMRGNQLLFAFIQGRQIILNSTQQDLFERYKKKYSH